MIDTHSATWTTVAKWAQDEIDARRTKLETRMSHELTENARSEITILRKLLALPVAKTDSHHAGPEFGISHPEV